MCDFFIVALALQSMTAVNSYGECEVIDFRTSYISRSLFVSAAGIKRFSWLLEV